MIKKILETANVGSYANTPTKTCPEWNGEFKGQNVIYGENGAGKTTLAIILTSLSGNNALLKEKKKIGSDGEQKIRIIMGDNSIRTYSSSGWDRHCPEIKVFDIHYIEDNVYIGSSLQDRTRRNLFQIVAGEEGLKLNSQLEELHQHLNSFRHEQRRIKARLKDEGTTLPKQVADDLTSQVDHLTQEIRYKVNHIRLINVELGEHSKRIFEGTIDATNNYLQYFTPHIRLEKFSKKHSGPNQLVSYSLSVSGEVVGFEGMKGGFKRKIKYSLSEGDKSAFAFSFFLAQLEKGDLSEKIVVFDDPISSFDLARRNATITHLLRIASKCKQLFISTHDIHFAKAISRRLNQSTSVSLKISKNVNTSQIEYHDIESETLGGVFKDINVLRTYLAKGAGSELEKREVVRCIRPILEGIIRLKFFDTIDRGEWLGNMLRKIEASQPNDRLHRLKDCASDIQEINDYSKEFHHSDPTSPWGDVINNEELRLFVNRTLKTIDKI
jgi:wobble nucleotide-excising tRNase